MPARRDIARPLALLAAAIALGAPPAASAAGGCDLGDPSFGTPRQDLAPRVLELVNAHRASIGRGPLALSPGLTRAALWKSGHMISAGYFAHDDAILGRSPWQRMTECGYPDPPATAAGAMGENIAYGYGSPESVMAGWLASSGHRANIEGGSFTAIGIGVSRSPGGTLYWTQTFGGTAPPPAGPLTAVADVVRVEVSSAPVAVDVLANDAAPFGRPLWLAAPAAAADAPAEIALTADGSRIEVRPRPGRTGEQTVVYRVSDISGATASGELRISVAAPAAAAPAPGGPATTRSAPSASVRLGAPPGARVQVRLRVRGRPAVATATVAADGTVTLRRRVAAAQVLGWRLLPARFRPVRPVTPGRVRVHAAAGTRIQLAFVLRGARRVRGAVVGEGGLVAVPPRAAGVAWRVRPAPFTPVR